MTSTAQCATSDAQREAPTTGELADRTDPDRARDRATLQWSPPSAKSGERLRRIEAVTDVALSKLTTEDLLDELLARLQELLDVDNRRDSAPR
jgi:hypothetical protein